MSLFVTAFVTVHSFLFLTLSLQLLQYYSVHTGYIVVHCFGINCCVVMCKILSNFFEVSFDIFLFSLFADLNLVLSIVSVHSSAYVFIITDLIMITAFCKSVIEGEFHMYDLDDFYPTRCLCCNIFCQEHC